MKTAPVIIVQLIHIEGPQKGQIVELSDPVIKIGRHPSCQLKFPAKLAIVSREHAVITREGNRFKITDHSSNGTIVNGKKITEIFLKDGDVITVSEGGPKVSFLTQMTDTPMPPKKPAAVPAPEDPEPSPPPPQPEPPPRSVPVTPEPEPVQASPEPKAAIPRKVPCIIQYGPTLRSFDELPLRIGNHPDSGCRLDHPALLDLHAEIYFDSGEYCIRDLTGKQLVTTNGIPAAEGTVLQNNDLLALSDSGPFFRYLGNGRLSEEEQEREEQVSGLQESPDNSPQNGSERKAVKKPLSFLQKILKKT